MLKTKGSISLLKHLKTLNAETQLSTMEKNKISSHQPKNVIVLTGDLSPTPKAGMQLTKSLLWIIAGVILLYALLCLNHGCNQNPAPDLPSATAATHHYRLISNFILYQLET
ncbi:hypothetical protein WJU16_01455 [Chitinophaga pollutisoli]|uniref:Uncharacterized protein n=1 Tax=Chitinophaga pollutisoli TaxID=3133966 RepID=A0ABZ2YS86_9BACT